MRAAAVVRARRDTQAGRCLVGLDQMSRCWQDRNRIDPQRVGVMQESAPKATRRADTTATVVNLAI